MPLTDHLWLLAAAVAGGLVVAAALTALIAATRPQRRGRHAASTEDHEAWLHAIKRPLALVDYLTNLKIGRRQ